MFTKGVFRGSRGNSSLRWAVPPVVLIAALALSACGASDGANQEEIAHYQKKGAERVHEQERLRNLEKELKHIKHGGGNPSVAPPTSSEGGSGPAPESAPAPPASVRSCGGELEANSNTTCPFAEAVEIAYFAEVGSGSGEVEAYSHATHITYDMYCTGSPHECTGGNNAAVYFP